MKKLNWDKIEKLLEEVLSLPDAERIPFLDAACADDPELRRELEILLKADEASSEYLEQMNSEILAPALVEVLSSRDPFLGTRLGPYEVTHNIARGGMGAVYRGKRVDGLFEQTVALKVVRKDMTTELSSRFQEERHILGKLEHPSIARILDGGVSSEGRPWLAMEYVKGQPITLWADRKRLSVNERLELFRSVCEAVSYAHRNLIVHRDLKPSNILVTEDGTVKLLDFGISKLLDESHGSVITHTGNVLLTPEYAAPEQLTGTNVSLATDIYALGVILYELLTGRRPYRIPSRVRREIERVIIEEEPVRPSAIVTDATGLSGDPTVSKSVEGISRTRNLDPEALKRRLSGDLDVIILKALRKEPERRYDSVPAFSEDIVRHLNQLPVSAQADSVGYRVVKFVRRNRVFVVAASLVVLSLIGGLAAALWQAGIAQQEANIAREEAEWANTMTGFLVGMFSDSELADMQGDSVLVRHVLDNAIARLPEEFGDRSHVQAYLESRFGEIYFNLGRFDLADSLLSLSRVNLQEYGEVPLREAETIAITASLRQVQGRMEEATSLYWEALEIFQQEFSEDNPYTARAMVSLGWHLVISGNHDEAEPLLRDAYSMWQRLSNGEATRDLGVATSNLALLYYYKQEYDEAIHYFEDALEIQRTVVGNEPHPDLAIALDNFGAVLMGLERNEEAEPYIREAVEIQRALYGNQPQQGLVTSLNNYGVVLQRLERYEESEAIHNETLELKLVLYGYEHPSTSGTLGWLALVARHKENYSEAETLYLEAIRIAENTLPPGHSNWAGPLRGLAIMFSELDRWEEAEQLYLLSYERTLEHFGPEHIFTVNARRPLAEFYEAWGRPDEAAKYRIEEEG